MIQPEPEDPWSFTREIDLSSNGSRQISVTKVLRWSGMVRWFISPEKLMALAQHGRDVHLVCEDIARGDVPDYWSELPAVAPYAEGFQKFCRDFDYQAMLIEHKVEHPAGYRGRIDSAGMIYQGSRSRRRLMVIDVKKGAPAPSHQYQLAAYAEALRNHAFNGTLPCIRNVFFERICVYLDGQGGYTAKRYENPLDFAHFTALLTTARIREAAGLVSERDDREFDNLLRYAGAVDEMEPRL